jgi:hypothetical protein
MKDLRPTGPDIFRPNKYGYKRLGKMSRRELQAEVNRLTEVIEITARRHAALKAIVDEFQIANRPRHSLTIITGTRTTK